MKKPKQARLALPAPPQPSLIAPKIYLRLTAALAVIMVAGTFTYVVSITRQMAFDASHAVTIEDRSGSYVEPFPIGVDPVQKLIVEIPNADQYMNDHSVTRSLARGSGIMNRLVATLAQYSWYQNLATPSARILVIQPGERKEEIASNFGKILGWSPSDKALFMKTIASSSPEIADGKFFPATYVTERHAPPEVVAPLVAERFKSEVLSRYTEDIDAIVPIEDALTIASLLEREAAGFEDMRIISGIIWNRLFLDMKLQIDATLQYARGTAALSRGWWPVPRPADKDIESPFNTYQNEGLPPSPIANPSLDAILAALNPKKTDCLFYFHDQNGGFHCSPTYEGHVDLLKQYYGRGK
jgi:UPF0755 protein